MQHLLYRNLTLTKLICLWNKYITREKLKITGIFYISLKIYVDNSSEFKIRAAP